MQLIDALCRDDLPAVEAAAVAAIADFRPMPASLMPLSLRLRTPAHQARVRMPTQTSPCAEGQPRQRARPACARTIIADVWIAAAEPQRALDLLAPLLTKSDDNRCRDRAASPRPGASSLSAIGREFA